MDYATLPPLLNPLPYRGFAIQLNRALTASQVTEQLEDTAVYVAPRPVLEKRQISSSYETEKISLLDVPENNQAFAKERVTMREDQLMQKEHESRQLQQRLGHKIGPPRSDESVSTRDLDDPTMPKKPAPVVTVTTPTQEEGTRIGKIITKKDITRLNQKVNQLYEEVKEKLVATPIHSTQALSWLNEAHTIIMARPEQFLLAELRVHQTELLLKQVDFSQQAANQYAWRLNLWNLGWLVIFALFFVFDAPISHLLTSGWISPPDGILAATVNSLSWYFQPWLCGLAGGIGGSLTALIILGREIKAREYDPASNSDYYLNGLKGLVFGILTYFILLGGFISSMGFQSEATELIQRVQVADSPPFILFAFLAGFEQQRLLALLARIWSHLTGEVQQSPTSDIDANLTQTVQNATLTPIAVSNEAFQGPSAAIGDDLGRDGLGGNTFGGAPDNFQMLP